MSRHYAGKAHYRGDVRAIVGEVKGPATYRAYLVAERADYDRDADRTTVHFATIDKEVDLLAFDEERRSLVVARLEAAR